MANVLQIIERNAEEVEKMIIENEEENERTIMAIVLNQALPEITDAFDSDLADSMEDEEALSAWKATMEAMETLVHYHLKVLEEQTLD